MDLVVFVDFVNYRLLLGQAGPSARAQKLLNQNDCFLEDMCENCLKLIGLISKTYQRAILG